MDKSTKLIELFNLSVIAFFTIFSISCSSSYEADATASDPSTNITIKEPVGIQGQSKKLVCGTHTQDVSGSDINWNLPNKIPLIVASVDSDGNPLLLGLNSFGSAHLELSAQSTAESLVYCAPFICPADNESADALMAAIREEPEVRNLASMIENSKDWKLANVFDNNSPESKTLDKAIIAVARRVLSASRYSSSLRLAQNIRIQQTEFAGVKVSQISDSQIKVENGKRHWLVVTGLSNSNSWNLVPSNPSLLTISGALSSWTSSSTFELGTEDSNLRIYGWGIGSTEYWNSEASIEDKSNLGISFALTVAFDGVLRTSSSILGVVTDDWVKDTTLKLLLRIRSGGLLSNILNKLDRRDAQGAAKDIMLFAIDFAGEEVLKPMADATAENLISGVFNTVVHGFMSKAKLVTDLVALAWDNAGNSFVIGVNAIGPGTTNVPPTPVPTPPPGPTDQELIQKAIYAEIPDSPPCSSIDVRGDWALATIPSTNDAEGASVLLKKTDGVWKILDYGTSIEGDGAEFGVPKEYWRDWNLGANESGYRPQRSDLVVGVEMALQDYLGSAFDESALGVVDLQGKWALMPYGNQTAELWLFHMENSVQPNGGPWRVVGHGSVEQIQQTMINAGVPKRVRQAWGYD